MFSNNALTTFSEIEQREHKQHNCVIEYYVTVLNEWVLINFFFCEEMGLLGRIKLQFSIKKDTQHLISIIYESDQKLVKGFLSLMSCVLQTNTVSSNSIFMTSFEMPYKLFFFFASSLSVYSVQLHHCSHCSQQTLKFIFSQRWDIVQHVHLCLPFRRLQFLWEAFSFLDKMQEYTMGLDAFLHF